MNILSKINSSEIKFTKSEKLLIKYINKGIDEFSYKSISEIAKDIGVGESTITRFSKKLGFASFQDFKVTLACETNDMHTNNIIDESIDNKEHSKETCKKILNNNIYVLESTSQSINYDNIHKCSDMIRKANRIFFIGIGYSGIIAQDINYKCMRIGINSNCFSDTHTILMMSSILTKDDVLVCISHSGETEDIIKAINIAKTNNVNIISITNDYNSKISKLSDISLSYVSNETIFETGSMYSKLAQMFILDLIYTQLVKDMGGIAINNKLKTTDAIRKK